MKRVFDAAALMIGDRRRLVALTAIAVACVVGQEARSAEKDVRKTVESAETQITDRPTGHILTNVNVWSPDGQWIVYDTRPDAAGEKFLGTTIEAVNVATREVKEIYQSKNGAHCGVATFGPRDGRVVFILGPKNPTGDWQYGASHRQGAVVDMRRPGVAMPLDARDVAPPFTPGALRGGTHVHVFDPQGEWVRFTYEDHVLAALDAKGVSTEHERNQRNVGVSVTGRPVVVSKAHPRNHDGAFTVLVTETTDRPRPGSDEISRACEESWIGTNGYTRADGSRQERAIAFQGTVTTASGEQISEVFVCNLPDDLTTAGSRPLEGTATTRPAPPRGVTQRRITHTADRKYPGVASPRHWLHSSADGSRIGFLMRDDAGVAQLWTVSPNGGEPIQVTRHSFGVGSAFSWSPRGEMVAYVADNSVYTTDVRTGESIRRTLRTADEIAPRPEACVFSPDGRRVAYVRPAVMGDRVFNQIYVVEVE